MRIGVLYSGEDQERIHGSAITTYYLKEAFERLGHEVWRWSVTSAKLMPQSLIAGTDLVISEGVPHDQIISRIWRDCTHVILWHLSGMFYHSEALLSTPFHAVATNSRDVWHHLSSKGKPCAHIELAAPLSFASAISHKRYRSNSVYLGCYPHKSLEQLMLLLRPAISFGLAVWGYGWKESIFSEYHRGILPLGDIGSLYRSVDTVLALTENKQKMLNMINNRIYEGLAAGTPIISDEYLGLKAHELGEFINFTSSEAEVTELLCARGYDSNAMQRAKRGQRVVLERHTYDVRARQFLALHQSL